jgi:cytochrome c553
LAKPAPAAPEAVNMASVNLREAAERLMAGGEKAEAINTGHPSKERKRRMKKTKWMAAATAALVMAALGGAYAQQQAQRNVNDWLLNAPDDTTRFQLLQRYLRGFDQPMWEVGERFRMIHQALADENWELALYHWEKTRDTIVNGYLKRPLRQPNSQAMFVDNIFQPTLAAFRAGNSAKAWEAFQTARAACMSCHEAERVTYMNNQALFRLTEQPARPGG